VNLARPAAVSLLTFLAATACSPLERGADVAITGVTIIDVARGQVQPGRTIVIDEGRIVAVAESA
jgi:adenine deaminase